MKLAIPLLIAFAVSFPAMHHAAAQDAAPVAPAAPTITGDVPEDLGTIDPGALRLLSQLAAKYGRPGYYSGVIDLRYGDVTAPKLEYTRFRVAVSGGITGVISKSGDGGSERWVSDGRQTLATASRRAKEFIRLPLNASGFWRVGRDEFFLRAGFEGILSTLLREQLGDILLEPTLRSVTLLPTTENGATQKIVIYMAAKDRQDSGTVALYVGDDLLLKRATMNDKVGDNPGGTWDEIYTETVMQKEPPPAFYATTSTAPPRGYTRTDDFNLGPSATAPVDNTPKPAPSKKGAPEGAKKVGPAVQKR